MGRSRTLALVLGAAAALALGLGTAVGAQPITPATDHDVVIVHVVRNGHPAQGRVTIRDEAGNETTCETNAAGECEIEGLAAGRHVVEATGADGTTSAARAVMIPGDGKVSLIVQLPGPNAAE